MIDMRDEHPIWQTWAGFLHRWGLQDFMAWLLEAIEPINLLGAQLVYIGEPLLDVFVPDGHTKALAQLLEEPKETQAFVKFLKEEKTSEYK
ncbi:MAG: hypothetical protein ACE5GO_07560 [Anaerolineales bacterium]